MLKGISCNKIRQRFHQSSSPEWKFDCVMHVGSAFWGIRASMYLSWVKIWLCCARWLCFWGIRASMYPGRMRNNVGNMKGAFMDIFSLFLIYKAGCRIVLYPLGDTLCSRNFLLWIFIFDMNSFLILRCAGEATHFFDRVCASGRVSQMKLLLATLRQVPAHHRGGVTDACALHLSLLQ